VWTSQCLTLLAHAPWPTKMVLCMMLPVPSLATFGQCRPMRRHRPRRVPRPKSCLGNSQVTSGRRATTLRALRPTP
jgi:hypothetical protein